MKKLIDQILKFGIVGVTAFFIDFGLFKLLSMVFGVNYLIANVISFTVSLIYNYVLSMTFVFERRENADKRTEFIKFTLLSLVGLLLNEVIIYACVSGIYFHVAFVRELISQQWAETFGKILATGIVMVYNFITRKIFLEKKD